MSDLYALRTDHPVLFEISKLLLALTLDVSWCIGNRLSILHRLRGYVVLAKDDNRLSCEELRWVIESGDLIMLALGIVNE